MKIIKRVDLKKIKWRKEYTCKRCTSVIEVELSDLKTTPAMNDGPYYQKELKYFNCPVCMIQNDVLSSDIPKDSI